MKTLLSPTPIPTRRWWLRTIALNATLVMIVFVAIQFVPAPQENPPVLGEPEWTSTELHELTIKACYDCHSNLTEWPWYSQLAPLSWVIWYDVVEGREDLNFSEWDRHTDDEYVDPDDPFPPKTLSERIEEEIRSGDMPPGTYRLLNPEARLTDEQKEFLIQGLIQTVRQNQDPPLEP